MPEGVKRNNKETEINEAHEMRKTRVNRRISIIFAAMLLAPLAALHAADPLVGVERDAVALPGGHRDDPAQTGVFTINLSDIRVRDPFIVADRASKTYYLYAQCGNRQNNDTLGLGVEVYASKDLAKWSAPVLAFERPKSGFWAGSDIWAPEVHQFGKSYFMFVTFPGRSGGRGTQILRADRPEGPFQILGDSANTPPEEQCLDGTPWIDEHGVHWMVYCNEWTSIKDGTVRAVLMTDDWSARKGESILLFRASEAPWVRYAFQPGNFVTDGPFLHRTKGGKLLMIWSSFRKGGDYAVGVAESESGSVKGPWRHSPDVLFGKDGGHGMIFRDFAGDLLCCLHQPNGGNLERAHFFKLKEDGGRLALASLHDENAIPVQQQSNDHKAPVSLDADKDSKAVPLERMRQVYEEVKTPFKYGVVIRGEANQLVDSPSVFRKDGQWYMVYASITERVGYETCLARSADLLKWEKLGKILSFRPDGWDRWQRAGYLALSDTTWGGSCELQTYDGKYWMSFLGGALQGYETDPLAIGLAWTKTPTEAREWTPLTENPVLHRDQPDVRPFEKVTLYKSNIIWDKAKTLGSPFVMYYNGKIKGGYEKIGMAVSDDMIHWKRYGKDSVVANGEDKQNGITGDPQVVKMGDLWVMFYFGAFWRPGAFDTFACSTDLVNWTKWTGPDLVQSSEPWDKTFAHKPWLVKHDGVVYHFYCAVGDQGRVIALATSKDLKNESKQGNKQ